MKQLINIDVPDLAAAEAFYSEAFGLHGARRLGSEVLEMLGGSAPLYLLQKASGSVGAGGDAREYGRHWMPLHIADPFGHGWCLLQFVGRGYDEITI